MWHTYPIPTTLIFFSTFFFFAPSHDKISVHQLHVSHFISVFIFQISFQSVVFYQKAKEKRRQRHTNKQWVWEWVSGRERQRDREKEVGAQKSKVAEFTSLHIQVRASTSLKQKRKKNRLQMIFKREVDTMQIDCSISVPHVEKSLEKDMLSF